MYQPRAVHDDLLSLNVPARKKVKSSLEENNIIPSLGVFYTSSSFSQDAVTETKRKCR